MNAEAEVRRLMEANKPASRPEGCVHCGRAFGVPVHELRRQALDLALGAGLSHPDAVVVRAEAFYQFLSKPGGGPA